MGIKLGQAMGSAVALVREPFDFKAGVRFFDAFAGWGPMRRAYGRMLQGLTEREREHLRELTQREVDLPALAQFPEGSLGRAYARFFEEHGLHPDAQRRAHPALADTYAQDWVYARFARVHDFHHILLDFEVDARGELGLQAFNLLNFCDPFGALAMVASPRVALRYGGGLRFAREIARGAALGVRLPSLFTAPFEDWMAEDLASLRRRLGVPSPHVDVRRA